MNAPERIARYDVQSRPDGRNLRIDAVCVKGVRYPVAIHADEGLVPTIATISMTVSLTATEKGTHMSRFVELLEARAGALDRKWLEAMVVDMLDRLGVHCGSSVEMRFSYFVKKAAPISGAQNQLDHEVCWHGSVSDYGAYSFWIHVTVPAKSLCSCSKEISEYGAHNQHTYVTIKAEIEEEIPIGDLIGAAERSASCEVCGLLKRRDEKYLTERAYDNPKFVEDLVRDVALSLNRDPRVGAYLVEAEDLESIHNHSAFARISSAHQPNRHGQR